MRHLILALALFAPVFSAVAQEPATTYDLSDSHGRLFVVVRAERGGLFGALGHDHVVVASDFEGTMVWNAADATDCDVRIDVPVRGLVVDPGASRSWAGLDGETSDGDKSTIQENLRSDRQLDVSNHPSIAFRSTGCIATTEGAVVTGDMRIHGVSHRVSVPMRITPDGDQVVATGRFTVNHEDFGMRPYRALAGALRNQEALEFVVDVRGVRTSSSTPSVAMEQ